MKTHITDALQVLAAILITSGIVAYAAPLPDPSQVNTTPVVQAKQGSKPVETKPVEAPQAPEPAPVAPEPVSAPEPAAAPQPVATPAYSGSHTDMLAAAGIDSADFEAADFIVMHEGHYDPCVWNGGYSNCDYSVYGDTKAYGVCQAFPGSKMASAGADWLTNPVTQLKWCASYAASKGGWQAAKVYWIAHWLW